MPHSIRLSIGIALVVINSFLLSCRSVVPGNYMSSSNMKSPLHINHQLLTPRLIEVSPQILEDPRFKKLLRPALKPPLYRIGAFDSLNITVWVHPEFSTGGTILTPEHTISSVANTGNLNATAVVVDADGCIFFPFIDTLKVSGMTLHEAQTAITKKLARYFRKPQVTVQVQKYRNRVIYVLGAVMAPGMVSLSDKPVTLMEALSITGNINPIAADPSHIYIIRGDYRQPDIFWFNATNPQSLMIAEKFPLQENDIVFVSSAALTELSGIFNQIMPQMQTYAVLRNFSV